MIEFKRYRPQIHSQHRQADQAACDCGLPIRCRCMFWRACCVWNRCCLAGPQHGAPHVDGYSGLFWRSPAASSVGIGRRSHAAGRRAGMAASRLRAAVWFAVCGSSLGSAPAASRICGWSWVRSRACRPLRVPRSVVWTCVDSMHCCINHCRNKELLNEIQQKHKRLVSTMKQAPPLSDRLPY